MKEYKIGKNTSIVTDRAPTLLKDWLDEGRALYGDDPLNLKFRCPMCGKVYSVREFIDAGGKDGPNGAYQECIGRYTGAGSPKKGADNSNGCNWAAYGLFGTCGKGRLVKTPHGDIVEVFHYADESEEGGAHE